ncbi:MAG: Gfo/Idh/MocA family oxidoreductase [Synergistes sp.]|nr:Gfo/Idh/MocA family oxidoreductase [Synergistes sp.]
MGNIRVGVVGVGHLGMHHARIYNEIMGAELVGVADIDKERAGMIGDRFCVPAYSNIEELMKDAHPDAVSIVVPTSAHYEVARTAIENGLHVLIEKPVTTTVDEAEDLLERAVKKDVILQVGHIERFNSAVEHAREYIKNPYFIQTRRMGPFTPRIRDVGVVLDLMIHDIDIILSMVNSEITSISAMGRKVATNYEDIASVQLQFENGTLAQVLVSRVSEKRLRTMEISEPDNFVTLNFETQDITLQHCEHKSDGSLIEVIEHPVFPKTEPLKIELQHFISCIREGHQPMVGIKDGKRALEVCVAVLRQIDGEE